MNGYLHEQQANDFDAIRLGIASPERIIEWSHGQVLKPETINYRTQKPEKDGLFCERIFGPTKDWECSCGKYKGVHYRGVVCDRCGVLVARSIVRRERMGHINLAVPVTHIWFLRGTPSSVGLVLNMTAKSLEKIVYFANYVITKVDKVKKEKLLNKLDKQAEKQKIDLKKRFESESKAKDVDIKQLAEQQSEALAKLDEAIAKEREELDLITRKALLVEFEYRDLTEKYGDLFEAMIGAEAIEYLLNEIDLGEVVKELSDSADQAQGQRRRKILKRLKMLEGMHKAGIEPVWMIIKNLPVIPPDLRPMVQLTGGRFATSDLNDLYRRVINRNNRLQKLIEMNAPEVIRRNEMRMLQEAVDALIDNSHTRGGRAVSTTGGRRRLKSLSDMLRGKQGRFRQNLLGKRVDYSGRSVIVAGPELKMDECGLPKMMALELFKPFVIGRLIDHDLVHNVKVAGRMIERGEAEVWDALDEVIQNKYVLLNRAPTLHRLGVQAFRPRLIEGKAIQLHPLVCAGFNADFDGDQMAVHLPLSIASQQEARDIMAARKNLLKPSDGTSIVYIAQDMVLGAYYMTYRHDEDSSIARVYSSSDEVRFAYEGGAVTIHSAVKVNYKNALQDTTVGRLFFNEVLPEDYPYLNEVMDDKKLQDLLDDIIERYGHEITAEVADSIKRVGFSYATTSGLSTGMDDYTIPQAKDRLLVKGEQRASEISEQYEQGLITDEERYRLTIENWREINEQTQAALKEEFTKLDNSTTITVDSGARAKMSSVSQISAMLGLIQDVYGNTIELPIKSNYKEGLTLLEYFTAARGSRKGLVDTALKTADSGYLTRRLVDVAQDVFTYDDLTESFGPGEVVKRSEAESLGQDFIYRVTGRCAARAIKDKKGKVIVKKHGLITKQLAHQLVEDDIDEVEILTVFSSPLSERGINRLCYGADLATGRLVEDRVPIGVIAAQAVGEPGTQLTLDTFHKGGVAGEDITQGFPRVEELFEARVPKGQAIISEINGAVSVKEVGDNYYLRVSSPEAHVVEQKLPRGLRAVVKSGQTINKNEVIAADKDGKNKLKAKIAGIVTLADNVATIINDQALMRDYKIPTYRSLAVKDGDMVTAGMRLTSGSINLQELLLLTDEQAVQRYIMTEIQSIFSLQGQTIADKHLEVIVRQMTSRVQIEDPGDSLFVIGDIVSKAKVAEENVRLSQEKNKLITYKQLLLGITKVSTWSDSFLSAASFQDTTRVLISAATAGKVDRLYGLKENVIIGRQIPVGTGYHGIETESTTEVE